MADRILLTGGLGFIGSAMIDHLLSRYPDMTLVCLDALTYAGRRENVASHLSDPRFTLAIGDICDSELLADLFDRYRFTCVLNFAAETHVDRSIQNAAPFIHTNVEGVNALLEQVRRHPFTRFVQISTDEVYGPVSLTERTTKTEEAKLEPTSPYAASKAAGDLLALSYFRTYDLDVVITRSSNCYGPRQYPEKLIPLTIERIVNDRPIPVYGAGQNLRDWLHVEDDCQGIEIAMRKGTKGGIYNISAHDEHSVLEVVTSIAKALGREPRIEHVADRLGHDARYLIATERIEALGFVPTHRFADDIAAVVRSYLDD